jgi:hypothetical protein
MIIGIGGLAIAGISRYPCGVRIGEDETARFDADF